MGVEGYRVWEAMVYRRDSWIDDMTKVEAEAQVCFGGRHLSCLAWEVVVEERNGRRFGTCGGWRSWEHRLEDMVRPWRVYQGYENEIEDR